MTSRARSTTLTVLPLALLLMVTGANIEPESFESLTENFSEITQIESSDSNVSAKDDSVSTLSTSANSK